MGEAKGVTPMGRFIVKRAKHFPLFGVGDVWKGL